MKASLQEQLAAGRRDQILDAAAKVFAEKGFHSTTIRDIARFAGIADGTIYNYFENKTALLFGILNRMKETAQADADLSPEPPTDVRAFMKAYLAHPLNALKADNFALFRVVISEILVNEDLRAAYYQTILEPTVQMAEALFRQWAEQGLIKPVDVGLITRAISSLITGLMLEHIMGDPVVQAKWDDLPDLLSDLLLDGLRREKS